MRVAHLNTDPGVRPGKSKGAVVHVESMRHAFRKLGAEVVAVDAYDEASVLQALGRARRQGGLDLIYERFALHSVWGVRFARRHGIPHVFEINAPLDEEEARHRPGRGPRVDPGSLASQLRGSNRLLCVSQDVAAWARRRAGDEVSIDVVGNGVDVDLFSPRRRSAGLARRLTPEGRFVIGFHGRLRPWHAFGRLVEVLCTPRLRDLNYHLLLVGKGDFEQEIGGRIPRERWTQVPWVAHREVGELVATFDVMPLTYDPEQPCYFSPLKLLEGMAAGAVPVVPALGGLPAAVAQGRAGRIYDPHALEELAEILVELEQNPVERLESSNRARTLAARHSWRSIAERVFESVGVEVP